MTICVLSKNSVCLRICNFRYITLLNALNDVIDFATECLVVLSIKHLAKLDTVSLTYAQLFILGLWL